MDTFATASDTSLSLLDRLRSANSIRDWEIFCGLYEPQIRRHLLLRRVAGSDVDDQVQEVLSRVVGALPAFVHNHRPGAFRKWLGTIISQQAWRYFHELNQPQRVITVATSLIEGSQPAPDALEELWDREHDRYVVNRLLELIRPEFSETTWRAFQLMTVDSRTPDQAASALGITPNAVMIAKSRVLRRLRSLGQDLVDCFDG